MEGFQQYGDSEIAKITPFTHQDGHALNSNLGILQPTYSFKPYILLIRKWMEGFQQPHSHITVDHALNTHFGILQPTSSCKPYFLLIRNLMKSFLQNGDSEIAKITTFTHQRWPYTRQPSWNSSTTISFQTIYSLEQELEEGLPHNGFSKIA